MDKLSSEITKGGSSPTTVCQAKTDLNQCDVSESAAVSPAARLITQATSFTLHGVSWLVDQRIVSSIGPLKDVLILVPFGDQTSCLPRRAVQVEELETWIASDLVCLERLGSACDYNSSVGWNGSDGEAASQAETGA